MLIERYIFALVSLAVFFVLICTIIDMLYGQNDAFDLIWKVFTACILYFAIIQIVASNYEELKALIGEWITKI